MFILFDGIVQNYVFNITKKIVSLYIELAILDHDKSECFIDSNIVVELCALSLNSI